MIKKVFIILIVIILSPYSIAGALPIYLENVITINKKIFIPESFGIIEKSSLDKYLSPRLVVLIKDAHCNYDAQHNIARILEVLVRDYKIDLVAIEGAAGFLDFNGFNKLGNENAREKMADSFVKRGVLTGPEYLTISKDGKLAFNIYGIENEKLYMENFVMFRETMEHYEETELFINELKRVIRNLKEKIYPKGLFEFDDKSMKYHENTISLSDWVNELKLEADKKRIELKGYPNLCLTIDSVELEERIDFKKVEIERANALGSLEETLSKEEVKEVVEKSLQFRLGKISTTDYYKYLETLLGGSAEKYRDLMKYIQLVKIQNWINSDALFREISSVEDKIKDAMFADDIQRRLDDVSKRTRIISGMFKLTLTRGDLEYYVNRKADFMPDELVSLINIQAPLNNIPVSMLLGNREFLDKIGSVVSDGEKFYNIAMERDMALVQNTLQIMEDKQKASAVMVIGGFHAEGVLDLFERKGVGYVVISPKIMKAEKERIYMALMMDKRIKLPQEISTLAFPKMFPDGENVNKIIVPLGAEGWRGELLQLALSIYNKELGVEAEKMPGVTVLPFKITAADGKYKIERNPEYADTDTPNELLRWFEEGLNEAGNDFIAQPGMAEKYLNRLAVIEYRQRVAGTRITGNIGQATRDFVKFYLELCEKYEKEGWLGVQDALGARWKEFIPEPIAVQEFREGYKVPEIRAKLIDALEAKKTDIENSAVEAIVNYLLTMPAYGVDEKSGNFYEALFFGSYMGLIRNVFGADRDENLRNLLDRLQAYRYLQVYMSRLYEVENTEPLLVTDEIAAILRTEKLQRAGEQAKGEDAKKAEIFARYFSGEGFSEDEKRAIENLIRKKGGLGELRETDLVKAATGVNMVNEGSITDPLKREIYVSKITRADAENVLNAFDGYNERKKEFMGDYNYDGELKEKIRGRTFVHTVSMYLGRVTPSGEGRYEYSDLGSIGMDFITAVQRSTENDQKFLCKDENEKEAMKLYLARYGIIADDNQYIFKDQYNLLPRENRVIVAMLGEEMTGLPGDRVLIGNTEGTDLVLMNRLAMVVAGPDSLEGKDIEIKSRIEELLAKYICGTENVENIAAEMMKEGVFRILLPEMSPFIKDYYNRLRDTREIVSRAA